MDEATLLGNKGLWQQEPVRHSDAALTNLTAEEKAVFDDLRRSVFGAQIATGAGAIALEEGPFFYSAALGNPQDDDWE